jgi:spore maturation protein CgeB
LGNYFDFDSEILVFDSPSELRDLMESLKKDAPRRRQIAESSQARALRDHTYSRRAERLLSLCGFAAASKSPEK